MMATATTDLPKKVSARLRTALDTHTRSCMQRVNVARLGQRLDMALNSLVLTTLHLCVDWALEHTHYASFIFHEASAWHICVGGGF